MNLYHANGYANIPGILARGMTFNFVIGGRGTGKTFGALQHIIKEGIRFCFMRRTQSQLDTICRPETNPFKSVIQYLDLDWDCCPVPLGKNVYGYYRTTYDDDHKPVYGELLGYAIALSTVANLRGYDMTDIDLLVYDEFIPETHERAIRAESDAFFNCYETLNRNRELQGKKPIQVLCMANANDFACPLLIGLNLVSTVERMITKGQEEYVSPQRSVGIFLLTDSPVSMAKAKTALYKLTVGTAFSDMAISNAFEGTNDPDVYSCDLREYNPVVSVGELCIYKHKASTNYYITTHISGSVGRYSGDGIDMKRFINTHKNIMIACICGKIVYETHLVKALFLRYTGLN